MKPKLTFGLLNTGVIAAIVFISTLSIDYPPTIQNVWAATIGGTLALLTQIKSILQEEQGNGGTGGADETIYGVLVIKSNSNNPNRPKLGMLI